MSNARPSQNGINWSDLGILQSPPAVAKYAWLREPDNAFGTPKYSITVEVTPEWDDLLAQVLEFENAHLAELGRDPITKPSMLRDDGTIQFYTTQVDEPIPCADAEGNEIKASQIWRTDTVSVHFLLGGWFTAGKAGARGYLSGVQLLKDGSAKAERGSAPTASKVTFNKVDVSSLTSDEPVDTTDLEALLDG